MRDDAMNEGDELDALLDAALATYVDAEATPGLTRRILDATNQDVTSRVEGRGTLARWLPLAVPALAAVLLIVVFVAHRAESTSHSALVIAKVGSSRPAFPVRSDMRASGPPALSPPTRSVRLRAARALPKVAARSPVPRLDVFPTPAPLTPEEQALLAAANHRMARVSPQVAEVASRSDQQALKPIRIAAIDIPPLNPPEKGGN